MGKWGNQETRHSYVLIFRDSGVILSYKTKVVMHCKACQLEIHLEFEVKIEVKIAHRLSE